MLDDIKIVIQAFEKEDEIFNSLGNIIKKFFDSLTDRGFTREEAIQIVASLGGKK